ncbi:hypothetical protein FDP41_007134 [Naegleria fowleri]|uniref:Transmembrane protein n=1 Tax=Naegleria fowleri TaxID=5763 RepID=A0A6A5B8M3_NAEFO|nr:uncharacterized protein FDP41_007134 [Naegleria fowleri]KAF0973747.1 hypothetical protein FDP41_007134 [Naegleria fowleri]
MDSEKPQNEILNNFSNMNHNHNNNNTNITHRIAGNHHCLEQPQRSLLLNKTTEIMKMALLRKESIHPQTQEQQYRNSRAISKQFAQFIPSISSSSSLPNHFNPFFSLFNKTDSLTSSLTCHWTKPLGTSLISRMIQFMTIITIYLALVFVATVHGSHQTMPSSLLNFHNEGLVSSPSPNTSDILYYQITDPWILSPSSQNATSFSQIFYTKMYIPMYAFSLVAVVGQYSVSIFPPDSPMLDLCGQDSPAQKYKSLTDMTFYVPEIGENVRSSSDNLCLEFFCSSTLKYHEVENRKLNLTRWSQVDEFTWFYNYCLYCDNVVSREFKDFLINNSSTQSSENPDQSACPLFNPTIIQKAQQHCQIQSFQNKPQPYSIGTFFLSSDLMDSPEFRSVLSFYDFIQFVEQSSFPYNCFCKEQSLSLVPGIRPFSFAFACDIYAKAIIPLVFEFGPIFIFLYTVFLLFSSFFVLILPIYCAVYREYRYAYEKKLLSTIFDLRIQSTTILFFAILWMCAQEIFSYLFNFNAFSSMYYDEDSHNGFMLLLGNGLLRMISLVFLCCSFASMLVSWQHMTSNTEGNFLSGVAGGIAATGKALIGASKDEREHGLVDDNEEYTPQNKRESERSSLLYIGGRDPSESLSTGNKLILAGFYLSLLALLITVVIMSFFIHTLYIIFLVFIAFGMMYLWIFPIGFLFSGIRMYYKLKSMKENLSFARLKFTKFMIFADICFILLIIVGALFMLTYLFGWDLFGVFIGINRSLIMDFTIVLMMTIEQYMLFNQKSIKDLYGEKILMCCCVYKRKKREVPAFEIEDDNGRQVEDIDDEDFKNKSSLNIIYSPRGRRQASTIPNIITSNVGTEEKIEEVTPEVHEDDEQVLRQNGFSFSVDSLPKIE